ncbi:LysR substrate-binding domain-containing protein [Thalassotalea fusca]
MDKRLKYLNALHCFESAARHQSYSAAAEELFVSQAAISQQMRTLENALDIKLFVRHGRQMLLTQHGETLFNACRQGFEHIVQGLNRIQLEGIPGDLTVTSTHAFATSWIMPRLYKFSAQYPDINVNILGSNQVEDLKKKHLDLAIRFGPIERLNAGGTLVCEPFGEDYVYPVCSPELKQRMTLSHPRDLLNCRLVSLANERDITWEKWFEVAGVTECRKNKLSSMVTSGDMALSAALSGHGVTLAAGVLFSPYIMTGQLIFPFKIQHPETLRRYLAYDPQSPRIQRIQLFNQWLQEEMLQSDQLLTQI